MKQSLRDRVWRRAEGRCEYCRMPQECDELPFQLDHIIALKHSGRTVGKNLAVSCYDCNAFKGPNIAGVDPETECIVPLFHPRRDTWADHFEWDGPELLGRTKTGRATITVLRINDSERVTFRASLIAEGVFPPAESVR